MYEIEQIGVRVCVLVLCTRIVVYIESYLLFTNAMYEIEQIGVRVRARVSVYAHVRLCIYVDKL